MILKLNKLNIKFFLLVFIYVCIVSCNPYSHREEITSYDNGNIKSKKWIRTDGIIDGPNIKYYPNGNIEAMAIVKNGVINGKMVIYDTKGILMSLIEMKETKIKDGYKYSFYPNQTLKEVAYYVKNNLRYIKQFNEKGHVFYKEGYLPVEFSKVGETQLTLPNNENYLKRNVNQEIYIVKKDCPYDAMHIFINDGVIKQTNRLGYYKVFTNTKKDKVIISIRVYNKEYNGLDDSFGILVK